MNIKKMREDANAVIKEYERIQDLIADDENYPTYEAYVELNGGPNVLTVLNARDSLIFLDKVEMMSGKELERIAEIPVYQDDMRAVKDIKDAYGFTWAQMKLLRGGVTRERMTVKEMREYLGISKAEFSRTYDIPARTLDSWESGERTPAPYILKLLERAVREDKKAGK